MSSEHGCDLLRRTHPVYAENRVNHLLMISGANPASYQKQQGENVMGTSLKSAAFLIESRLVEAAAGDAQALYELGVAYSTGTHGLDVDLVEAHKWFNLAALNGNLRGQECRAEIAEEMSAREIAEAQRQARAWLSGVGIRRAA